jgi:hypothetical protein
MMWEDENAQKISAAQFAGFHPGARTSYLRLATVAFDAIVPGLVWKLVGTFGGDCYDAPGVTTVYRIVPQDVTFWLTEPIVEGKYDTLAAA